jgi:hypothetical protein
MPKQVAYCEDSCNSKFHAVGPSFFGAGFRRFAAAFCSRAPAEQNSSLAEQAAH